MLSKILVYVGSKGNKVADNAAKEAVNIPSYTTSNLESIHNSSN